MVVCSIYQLYFQSGCTSVITSQQPMRSFTVNGVKVQVCEPWAQGEQAPHPKPSLSIPGPKLFPFIQSPPPERKILPSGNTFLFLFANLSPFHYFLYTHTRTHAHMCVCSFILVCKNLNLF